MSAVLLSLAVGTFHRAAAADTKGECLSAFEDVQLKKRDGDLKGARDAAKQCSRSACQDAIRNECVAWLDELEKAMPSVVISARRNGEDTADVVVTVDGAVVARKADGQPVELNPGAHKFRFEVAGFPPQDREVVVRAGERNRSVIAEFGKAPTPDASARTSAGGPTPLDRPVPTVVWVLGGLGVAGLATFTGAAIAGASQRSNLQSSCSPFCADADVSSVRAKLVVADVGLAVGALSLGGAAYFFFTRPQVERRAPDVALLPSRSGATVRWTFAF